MELMKASLDKLYRKVYATPDGRVPEEVLRQIAFAVSNDGPQHCSKYDFDKCHIHTFNEFCHLVFNWILFTLLIDGECIKLPPW